MTATTDIYKSIPIADGQEIEAGDIQNPQRYLSARILDQILASMIVDFSLGDGDIEYPAEIGTLGLLQTPYAYTLNPGTAYPRKGSGNNKIQIAPGTLLQMIAAPNGNEAQLLAYTFVGTEEVTIANGDPSNPRVDLIQMQLAYVDGTPADRDFVDAVTGAASTDTANTLRQVTCTLSVKQGTPASSPFYPDPDAGCVAIAGVVVGATWAAASGPVSVDTAGAVLVLHDQRMPLGVSSHTVWPKDFFYDASHVTLLTDKSMAAADGDILDGIDVRLIDGGTVGRLVGVTTATVGTALVLNLYSGALASGSGLSFAKMNGTSIIGVGGGGFAMSISKHDSISQLHRPQAGPTVHASTGLQVGPPVWTNGRRSLVPISTLTGLPFLFLRTDGGSPPFPASAQLGPVTFAIARGL